MKNIEVPIAKRMLEIYASAVDGKINVTTEIIEAANTLYALQAEIERLKGEYARGITDCETVIDKEFERTGNIMNIIKAVSALLQKQK